MPSSSEKQIGKKGKSNHRWIVGGKFGFVLNKFGRVTDWNCATANVNDATFQPLIAQFEEERIVLADSSFHAQAGDPTNLKICPHGTWNVRMVVETVLSMLTNVCHFKKGRCPQAVEPIGPRTSPPLSTLGSRELQSHRERGDRLDAERARDRMKEMDSRDQPG